MLNKASRRFYAMPSYALPSLLPSTSLCSSYHTTSLMNQSIKNNVNKQTAVTTESYTERQANKGRFVSPHLTIYKFPITALSSITNRVTGVLLTVGNFK